MMIQAHNSTGGGGESRGSEVQGHFPVYSEFKIIVEYFRICLIKPRKGVGDGEVAQWLRVFIVLARDLSFCLSTHMEAHKHAFILVPENPTSMHAKHSYIWSKANKYIYKNKKNRES